MADVTTPDIREAVRARYAAAARQAAEGGGCCGARRCRRDPAGCSHDLSGCVGLGAPCPTAGYRPSTARG